MTRICRAKRVLEIGTLGAYSTIWMAKALPEDGKIITLEIDPATAKIAQGNIDHAGLTNRIEVKIGSALESLETLVLDQAEPFDLIFIDADKENNPAYFEYSLKLSKAGTVIIADNVIRKGQVIDGMSQDVAVRGIRKFNEMVAREPRVNTTVLQTVGVKGYDGLGLIYVEK